MRMRSTILLLAAALSGAASAARMSLGDAECAARAFASSGRHLGARLGAFPLSAREHSATDGSGFFSVRLSGGGTLFLAGDDTKEPVIAYTSADVDFDSLDPASPLRALLDRDARLRGASPSAPSRWRRLLAKGDAAPAYASLLSVPLAAASVTEPGDIRVPALLGTRWNQKTDRSGTKCFNLNTPGNVYCGCVATAMAQLMRHHRWPDAEHPVPAGTTFQCYAGTEGKVLAMQGGTYDWDLMATDAAGDRISNSLQRQEIGKLTSDAGISVRMNYTSGGSSAYGFIAANALMDTWHYGQATYLSDEDGKEPYRLSGKRGAEKRRQVLSQAFFSNIDAGCPVLLGIIGGTGDNIYGHSVVADGYGYDDDTDYVHLNLGWGGTDDVWYNLPTVNSGGYEFDCITDLVYNIFPTNDNPNAATLSGRILGPDGKGLAGASVKIYAQGNSTPAASLVSSATGVYGGIVTGGSTGKMYDVVAVSADGSTTNTLKGVSLKRPGASNVSLQVSFVGDPNRTEIVTCKRYVDTSGTIGNSWGNDIVLDDGLRKDATNFYVSASTGVDAPDRGTSAAPYATIQYAITNGQHLVDGDVFNVLPGIYYGCVETPETSVSIVSTDGPEVTVIDGEGCDCCYYGDANPTNLLSGFTITNGAYSGGICVGTATNCVIVDCFRGDYYNYGYGGGAYAATLYGCVLHNNEADYGGGAASCTLVNCTVYDNWANYSGGGVYCDCAVTNSIVWRNRATDGDVEDNWGIREERSRQGVVYCPSFAYSCTFPDGFVDLGGNTTNDPKCVSFDIDDWRLRVGSPCAGTASDGLNMGAWQGDPIDGYVISATATGRGSVSPRSQFVPTGEDAVFTASGDHPFLGFETNGVFASVEREFVWRDVRADGEIVAAFGVTNYCIDAVLGDDANDGLSWATPFRTIYGMVTRAGRGDRVAVKPGVYDGCNWCVYGVEVESTDGAAATVIDGGGTNRCIYANDMVYRGFTLRNGNAGTGYGGGGYYGVFVDCVISNCAAAFGGAAAGATLTNCLVVGNSAPCYRSGPWYSGGYGGGVYECDIVNCTLAGNNADSYGGGAFLQNLGEARNSVVCGNTCKAGSAYGNDVYGNRYWTMSNTVVDVDARFRDPANGDYRVLPSSPAIDAGDLAYVAVDHDLAGTNRVWGASVDCGCYEYHLPSAAMTDPGVVVGDSSETAAEKVAAAVRREGYGEEFAAAVTTLKDYAYLVEWAADHSLSGAEIGASPTGFISPALGADGLLEWDPTNVVFRSFAPIAGDTNARFAVTFPGYDQQKLNLPLLCASLGVVSAESLTDGFVPYGLDTMMIATPTNVVFSVTAPAAPSRFYKITVR